MLNEGSRDYRLLGKNSEALPWPTSLIPVSPFSSTLQSSLLAASSKGRLTRGFRTVQARNSLGSLAQDVHEQNKDMKLLLVHFDALAVLAQYSISIPPCLVPRSLSFIVTTSAKS